MVPPRSICNFEDFGQRFLLNFATCKKQPKSEFALGKIRQQPGETLQSYLDRFKEATLQVQGLEEKVHVQLLSAGLSESSQLGKSIYKDPFKSLLEFKTRSKKYLELEQMEIANIVPRRKNSPPRNRHHPGNTHPSRNPDSSFRPGRYETKYDKYTPLNASRAQVWREVVLTDMKKVDRPRPVFKKVELDYSHFCEFHNRSGHTTDQCWDLQDAKEKFIREGKLRQYVIKTQGQRGKRKVSQNEAQKSLDNKRGKHDDNECNVISGAMGGGGDTASQRRKYLKEVLSVREQPRFKGSRNQSEPLLLYFTEEDMKDVIPGHEDGLVITGTLVNCRVKRIFMDNGSLTNIISWTTFKRMNLDEEDFKPCKIVLIGFNGENTGLKGSIELRLTLGTKEAFKSERVMFVVADFTSPYNIILGKSTIHKWDMLMSTKHQKLKMIGSNSKVINIRGDQKESIPCYYNVVRESEGDPSSLPRIRQGDRVEQRLDLGQPKKPVNLVELDMREDVEEWRPEPADELQDIQI